MVSPTDITFLRINTRPKGWMGFRRARGAMRPRLLKKLLEALTLLWDIGLSTPWDLCHQFLMAYAKKYLSPRVAERPSPAMLMWAIAAEGLA
jgi:hypothetical protein